MPDKLSGAEQLAGHLVNLEAAFDLPSGFLIDLPQESDWSFVIKMHSLLEAALTEVVAAELRQPRIDQILRTLPMRGPHSKLKVR